jgi:predicted aconitase
VMNMFVMFITKNHSSIRKETERIEIEAKALKRTIEELTTTSRRPDLVFLGCPHCSLGEIRQIARLVEGKKLNRQIECWVCTSRHIRQKASKYVETIERTGAHVLVDMCTIVSWTEILDIETIMTNSAKTAHYAPTLNKADTILAPVEKCLNTSFRG